jgi:hypothetical protein
MFICKPKSNRENIYTASLCLQSEKPGIFKANGKKSQHFSKLSFEKIIEDQKNREVSTLF